MLPENKDNNKYTAENIVILKGLEAVRKRPSMYIGDVGKYGLHKMVFEIIDNSVDEAMAGFCKNIKVTIHKDGYITVEDDGRGIPVEPHPTGKNSLEIVLTTLHAGGKFNDDVYKTSGGLHGVGLSVVNALSSHLIVSVKRDNKIYEQEYKKGSPASDIKIIGRTKNTGTIIKFLPDNSILQETEFDFELIQQKLQHASFLNKIKTFLYDERTGESKSFFYKEGALEYLENELGKNAIAISDLYHYEDQDKNVQIDFCFAYKLEEEQGTILSFVNSIETFEGGTHVNGLKKGFYKAIREYLKNTRKYKEAQINLDDFLYGFYGILSIKIKNPEFEGQTKKKLNNKAIEPVVENFVSEVITNLLNSNKKIGKAILEQTIKSYEIRNQNSKVRKKSINVGNSFYLSGKLADCSSDVVEDRELFIVEGDSAGGTAKQARNPRFQAVLPLRGKILNIEKASMNSILENEEIKKIMYAIGIQKITKGGMPKEEIKNVKYGKIIIMTDADVDGAHIRTLLLTLFYKYMRPIIEDGRLFIALPPLYSIKRGDKMKYFWSQEDVKKELEQEHKTFTVQRYKGLGEMNPEQLWETTMNPTTRKLIQITIENYDEAENLIKTLMGKTTQARKIILTENQV